MKKIFSLIMAVSILCTSTFAAGPSETMGEVESYTSTSSEFAMFLEENSTARTAESYYEAKEKYISALRELGDYTDNDLIAAGYSEEVISLVKKLRSNESYSPELSELNSASPKMTFDCDVFSAPEGSNRTNVTFSWSFEWDSTPIVCLKDAVGVVWNREGMKFDSGDFSVTYGDDYTYHYSDGVYGIDMIDDNDNRTLAMVFPMSRDDTMYRCKSGEGYFKLSKGTTLPSVQVRWGYGHQYRAPGNLYISITSGVGLTFGTYYETMCEDIATFRNQ